MSSTASNHSFHSNEKYTDKELFKSIDLKFFENENNLDSPETEQLNETFTKSSRPVEAAEFRESANYEDDFLTDEDDGSGDDESFLRSSGSSEFAEDEDNLDSSLRISGIRLRSARSEDEGKLTDVSPLASDDETVTEDSSSYAKQQNCPPLFPKNLRPTKKTKNVVATNPRPKSSISNTNRSSIPSSTRLLNPNNDATDISKILEHVLALDNDDTESNCFSSVSRNMRPRSKPKKNLSVSAFRAREIDRENERLLGKLKKPHRKPLYPGAQNKPPQKRCHSAGINRTKQFEHIDEENSKLLSRLEQVKGSKFLARETLDQEHRDFVKYALNCSKSKSIAGITDYPSSPSHRPMSGIKTLGAWD